MHRISTARLGAGLIVAGIVTLGVGLPTASATDDADDNHGCVTTSRGYTYDCESGIVSWDETVTVAEPYNSLVLYDRSTKPQTLIAGGEDDPILMPLGPGPGSVFLGKFECGPYQWDVWTPKEKKFIAGHKGDAGTCETTPPTSTTTTTPPVTTTTPPVTTTTTTPPVTSTTTPPVTTTSTTSAPVPTTFNSGGPELPRTGPNMNTLIYAAAGGLLIVGGGALMAGARKQEA